MGPVEIIILGCAGILLFDTVGSLLARSTSLRYEWLTPGSFAIYAVVGFFAARAEDSFVTGIVAGAAVGCVEGTLGWLISRTLGLDRRAGDLAPSHQLGVVVSVVLLGAAFGALGGLLPNVVMR